MNRSSVFPFHSRVGQRGGGLNSSAARSEHEVSEIIDGISEHEVSSSFEDGEFLDSSLFSAGAVRHVSLS